MAENWCLHCDMEKAYCPHGNPEAAKVIEQETQFRVRRDCTEGQDGPTIDASMEGRCVGCDGKIEVGDRITHISEGWVHAKVEPQTGLFEGIV